MSIAEGTRLTPHTPTRVGVRDQSLSQMRDGEDAIPVSRMKAILEAQDREREILTSGKTPPSFASQFHAPFSKPPWRDLIDWGKNQ
jgi:hypothetical protein